MCITIFWQRETHVGAPRGVSDVEHSPNVTTVRGVDTLLNCRVHQLTNMTVSWIKHGGVHLLADPLVGVGEPDQDLGVVEEAPGDLGNARGPHDGVGAPGHEGSCATKPLSAQPAVARPSPTRLLLCGAAHIAPSLPARRGGGELDGARGRGERRA